MLPPTCGTYRKYMLGLNNSCNPSLMSVSSCISSLKGKHMSSIPLKKSSELFVLSLRALGRQWLVMNVKVKLEQLGKVCIMSQAYASKPFSDFLLNVLLRPSFLAVASHQSRVQTLVVTESKLIGKSIL